MSHLLFPLQWIFPPSDARSQVPILKIPHYNNAGEFVTDFCLKIAKRFLSNMQQRSCMNRRIHEPTPGTWWFDHVLVSVKCYSWSRDTAHFRPVDFEYQSVYSRVWELTRRETLRMMVFTSEAGIRELANSFASFQRPWWMEWPSHLLWLNISLTTDSSLLGQQMKM